MNSEFHSASSHWIVNHKCWTIMSLPIRSSNSRKASEMMKLFMTTFLGLIFGFFLGVSLPTLFLSKMNLPSALFPSFDITYMEDKYSTISPHALLNALSSLRGDSSNSLQFHRHNGTEDLAIRPKYLVTFTVGYDQKNNINAAVQKFSENFTILLFHYDGRTTEWDEFEWSKQAIHVSAPKQTKWWYAKRFLHPDIVAPYDYIFIWDEDLGLEHFDAEEYIKLVKKHKLEISQPGLDPERSTTWDMTKRRSDTEVHKNTKEQPGWCKEPNVPPCSSFVEIMAPVFSRDAWRCVWHMIQNDLVHGWGLDFSLRKCVEPAHERIGVVDAQWIVHLGVPSLGNQGKAENGRAPWEGVRERCEKEWRMFYDRITQAQKAYFLMLKFSTGTNITDS
ncbi:hypothetical protein LINGRAHAP2_LOCUS22872 [Linum grandiflorum]